MTKRIPNWLLLILVGTCSAVASAAAIGGIFAGLSRGSPVAVVPAIVQLGDHEQGGTATGRITVANSGTADLVLEKFATTCSRAAVEVERDGQTCIAGTVRVRPGEQAELIARVAVGGRPGTAQQVFVTFATNDSQTEQPMVELVVGRIKGGVTTVPRAVVFGDLPVGATLKQRVWVYDNAIKDRRLRAVRSLRPDRFTATLVPPPPGEERQADETAGVLIGVIEVTPVTEQVGSLVGRVEIQIVGEPRPTDYVEVIGQVVGPVTTFPDTLVLPRAAGGKVVYEGRVSVSARDGSPVVVTPAPAPPGWNVSIVADSDNPGGQAVLVSRAPASQTAADSVVIRLKVAVRQESIEVEIPVRFRRDGS